MVGASGVAERQQDELSRKGHMKKVRAGLLTEHLSGPSFALGVT